MAEQSWFALIDGRELGPLSEEELDRLIARGVLQPTHLVSTDRISWRLVRDRAGLNNTSSLPPTSARAVHGNSSQSVDESVPVISLENDPSHWHVASHDGKQYGPVDYQELSNWVIGGRVTAACQLRNTTETKWQPASDLFPVLAKQPASNDTGLVLHPPRKDRVNDKRAEQTLVTVLGIVLGLIVVLVIAVVFRQARIAGLGGIMLISVMVARGIYGLMSRR